MGFLTIISSILIVVGAILMLINIVSQRLTIASATENGDKDSRLTQSLIRIHMVFMVFFFFGYLVVLYCFIKQIHFDSSLFVAIIFFTGAIFVLLGIIIQRRMFFVLKSKNKKLLKYNDKLESDQERLLLLNKQLQHEMKSRVRAEESDQMKSDFLSLVSHELRTPLTSIYGFTKLIDKGMSQLENIEDKAEYLKRKTRLKTNLEIVASECTRLSRLINNVLDLAKIESGRVDWNDQRVPLKRVLSSSLDAVEGLFIDNDNIALKTIIPDDLPLLLVDPDLFTQVFVNLINNAVKYAEDGTIELSVERRRGDIHFSVSDTGQGIPPEKIEKIFDKFYIVRKGDTLGSKSSGTGLGLPICKEIVHHYGGKIWVESEMGKGSTFHVTLPDSIIIED